MDQIDITDLLSPEVGTEATLANFFYRLYPNKYLYEIETELFYFVNEHGLYICDTGNIDMMTIFNNDFHHILVLFLNKHKVKQEKKYEKKKEELQADDNLIVTVKKETSTKLISDVLKKLSKKAFFISVLEQLKTIYKKSKIQWNSDPNIVGFDIGVYDTNTYIFRNAKNEESINMTMGYDYKECSVRSRTFVMNFIKSLHENESQTSYLLK